VTSSLGAGVKVLKAVQYCRLKWTGAKASTRQFGFRGENIFESPVRTVVKWVDRMQKPQRLSAQVDEWLIQFLQTHFNLLMAMVLVGLCVWGLISGYAPFVVGLLVVGAVSYFFSLALALACGIVFTVLDIGLGAYNGFNISSILLQCVGYSCSAWLGFRHKQQKEQAKQRLLATQDGHEPQVLPWAVVNEVRTSLAAVRFLLFPLHDEHKSQELKKATDELSRLESLFNQIEQEELQRKRH
jgi:hypothetical protein